MGPRPSYDHATARSAPAPSGWLEVALQFALVTGAALLYFAVRGITEGGVARAVAHSLDLFDLERHLGLDLEAGAQTLVLDHRWLVTLANWVYIWGHWPVIGVSLFWLHHRHRGAYRVLRNGLFVSGAIGLVIFAVYPVAPPRLAPLSIVDTVTSYSTSYRVLQPPALVNKYAALPSLHAGWNVIVGIVVFRMVRNPFGRVVAVLLPTLMCLAVVATGNHYVVDVLVGLAVALVGLGLADMAFGDLGRRSATGGEALVDEHPDQLEIVEDQAVDADGDEPVDGRPIARTPRPHECSAAP